MFKRTIATLLILAALLVPASFADKRISEMTAAGSTTAVDLVPIVQGGLNYKATISQLFGYAALGDLPYGGAAGIRSILSGNTTTTRKFLRQVGDGVNSDAPAWDTITSTDVGLGNVDNTSDATKNAATVNLTNKTLDTTDTIGVKDSLFSLKDDGDTTKVAKFQASGITTGTTRTYTLQDSSDTLVGRATTDTLTNKTIAAGSNTISGLGVANIDTSTPSNLAVRSFGIDLDCGGSACTTGAKASITIPYDCTILGWYLASDATGSAVIDIWKHAGAVPTISDTIDASAKPTLSSAQYASSTTLTGWTTTVTTGDVIRFNVDSAATVTRLNLVLRVKLRGT